MGLHPGHGRELARDAAAEAVADRPLFRRFPALAGVLPHVTLADLPTPVERLGVLEDELGVGQLWVKRDDLSGEPYGGNKVRKLEFLLGEALRDGATDVVTFGAAGSNHALATAVYASRLGMRPVSVLVPQHAAPYVRRNLLAQQAVGARLFYRASAASRDRAAERMRERAPSGRRLAVVPMGGTSPLGTVGFVNAAFELAEQVAAGALPEPERLYVALGSMGTAAGLAIGCAAAGLRTAVVPVRVTPEVVANEALWAKLVRDTVALLRAADGSFPDVVAKVIDTPLRHDAYGEDYAVPTAAGSEAIGIAVRAGIALEGTYTGKAFAALVADGREGLLGERTVLFWDTYNSRDLAPLVGDADWRRLPKRFHTYFQE